LIVITPLDLEEPERLTERSTGDAVLLEHVPLRRERCADWKIAIGDLGDDALCEQGGGLARPVTVAAAGAMHRRRRREGHIAYPRPGCGALKCHIFPSSAV
jgi:hypothetical protein